MKTLYIDCKMGAAGDMLTAALLELVDNSEQFIEEINSIGLMGVKVCANAAEKCGICGTHITVKVDGEEENEHMYNSKHEHEHINEHEHSHNDMHIKKSVIEHHQNGCMHNIESIVSQLLISDKVKSDVMAIYKLLAEAESHVHGVPVKEIHFHEIGTMDAITDITSVCLLIEKLAPEQIIVSPINVGSGQVKCAHGVLPVPAPATAYILRDVPIYGGSIKSELCTPTGAAILKHFAASFGDMPVIMTSAIGYGMGKKDFTAANCVRILLGETDNCGDTVTELLCNIDDMTPEAIGFATTCLFEAGALDVYTVNIGMKKNRPGTQLCVLCDISQKDNMVRQIFKHTSTIGIRENISRRYTLNRTTKTISTEFGDIRKKVSVGFGVTREKPEYEDIVKAAKANNMSLADVIRAIEKQDK